MAFPNLRLRRLRINSNLRELVKETHLNVNDLISPLFVKENIDKLEQIESMPGQFRLPLNNVIDEVEKVVSLGIPAIILFGIPENKDDIASSASNPDGIIQNTIRTIKDEFKNDLVIIADLCLCQYTSHGHCGIVSNGKVLNDKTLIEMQKIAISYAKAGADIIAPSGMMDGQVHAIRKALDNSGFYDTSILAYSAKFASSFYGPFRDAADSEPLFGDRKTYQMDYANSNEAMREVLLDIEEGTDIIMVKPAMAYLDLIYRVKTTYGLPTAAYSVSGEYSMIKAASEKGWINERAMVLEIMTAIKRAGADMILTYYAKDIAKWLNEK
ncbi:MAG: porphobilinogen synthase [Promethearchaeota archaeon]